MTDVNSLPEPDADARAHSETLQARLTDTIKQNNGRIDFARYMQMCLFEPGLGYYVAGSHKLGSEGDFVTAPETSPLFAQALGNQCLEIFPQLSQRNILEFGAGSGRFMVDLLQHLRHCNQLPDQYYILEVSPDLQQRQRLLAQQHLGELRERIVWLDRLPENFSGIVIGNEVLDAMPVHLLGIHGDQLLEKCVGTSAQGFHWVDEPINNTELQDYATRIQQVLGQVQHYQCEVNLNIKPWLQALDNALQQAVILLIDYGYPFAQLYHPDRHTGTLSCYYRHRVHYDPFYYPGLQDITAHVDFSQVAEQAHQLGMNILGYTQQAPFLLGCGFEQLFQQGLPQDAQEQIHFSQQAKKLILPDEMGEKFKVIALGKNIDTDLRGFAFMDHLHQL